MLLGNRLRTARKNAGYTQKELAGRIGAKHNSISNWENGLNMPDPTTIEAICNVLDVTPNYLLMGAEMAAISSKSGDITSKEMTLIKKYRDLDRTARGAVDSLVDFYYDLAVAKAAMTVEREDIFQHNNVGKPAADFKVIRGLISNQSVAAGTGTYLDPDSFNEFYVRQNEMTKKAAFYVPVSGNSMEPKFHDGDILIIEQAAVRLGEIGIFTLDGHGFVKVRGKAELISLNPDYEPIPMDDDIVCNGKVIGVLEPAWVID